MHSRVPSRVEDASRAEPARAQPLPAPPAALNAARVLALQRSAGNHAVSGLLMPERRVLQRLKPGDQLPSHEQDLAQRVGAQTRAPHRAVIAAVQGDLAQGQLLAETAGKLQADGLVIPDDVSPAVQRVLTAAFATADNYEAAFTMAQVQAVHAQIELEESRKTTPTGTLATVMEFVSAYLTLCEKRCQEAAVSSQIERLGKRKTPLVVFPEDKRKPFAAALQKMKFVEQILASPMRDPDVKPGEVAKWRGGKNLDDPSNVIVETDGLSWIEQCRGDLDDGSFLRRLGEADRFIKLAVEPHLLAQFPAPVVKVHTKYGETTYSPLSYLDRYKFRAFQNDTEVHVAQNETTAIIVHELGHLLENRLGPEVWTDIDVMRRDRHAAAGGGATATPIGKSTTEARFAGEYPVTKEYTSKAYEGGATEVMSMTLEFLKRPTDTRRMIEDDPVQTAVVLRSLRPQEYAATKELREFDDYLPQAPS